MTNKANRKNRILYLKVFIGGMLVYLLAVLPFLIYRKGLFFYYGDYNVQQVPFLIFAHRAVREGRLFWNPLVDLGGNMTGSFAFYLWGSPFFWLTIPFPESWLPRMMPFLMALKSGTAAPASCAWIRTQTRSDKAAVVGAFLYAFSGFQASNIVFQHFHDVTAFFPLYLLAFDRFVTGSRKAAGNGARRETLRSRLERAGAGSLIGFTLMTALMSVINYYFFVGQVLFFVIYYMVRWGIRLAKGRGVRALAGEMIRILAAGTVGLMLSAFFLVQSIAGILGNSRISNVINGYDLIVYPDAGTPMAILKSFFMTPDLIARGTMFTNDNIRNGSLAFCLPCFAMAGVFAFWILRRRSWKKTLLVIFAVMTFVPVLNAAFSAFNSNFYTRWFYMPVLLCACMTSEALEETDQRAFTRGTLLSLACTALFILFCFLPVEIDGKWSFTGICENRKLLNTEIEATLISSAMLLVILFIKRHFRSMLTGTACLLLTVVCCIVSTAAVIDNGSSLISYSGFKKWKQQMLTERPLLAPVSETESDTGPGEGPVPGVDEAFSRIETDGTCTNYEMVWGYPTMHCFESTVHPSIFQWYRGIGMIRTVESTLPFERIGARAIMSVRRFVENTLVEADESYSDKGGIKGYTLLNDERGYNVHESENFIPMGFTFDNYMTEENYDLLDNGTISDRVLVRDIILSEEMAAKYGNLLKEDGNLYTEEMSYTDFFRNCRDRAASACSEFAFDKNGWHASVNMEKENLLFFSIPYDRGFSARVDGEPAEVERVDFGLTAIPVPAGTHEIVVTYMPRGFVPAAVLSALTAAWLLAFALLLTIPKHFSAQALSKKNS